MNKKLDLHMHSYYSDGTESPKVLVRKSVSNKISAISLTDHDNVDGIEEFMKYGEIYKDLIETIPGTELSSEYDQIEAHILGYYIDHKSEKLNKYLDMQKQERIEKTSKIIKAINKLGFEITEEEISKFKGIVNRGTLAGLMVKKGYVKDTNEAFGLYLSEGKPAFYEREKKDAKDVISIIRECKGVPVLAHPYIYKKNKEELEKMFKYMKENGLEGIEFYYQTEILSKKDFFFEMANKYSLILTGGSDYHGKNKNNKLGVVFGNEIAPYDLIYQLKEKRES